MERGAKVIVVGDSGIGKTCLVCRLVDNTYRDRSTPTVGVGFSSKSFDVGLETIKLSFWDTAGQERYRSIVRFYYHGAQGILLCFDITNRKTYDSAIGYWYDECSKMIDIDPDHPNGRSEERSGSKDRRSEPSGSKGRKVLPIVYLIGLKKDLHESRVISKLEASMWALAHRMTYYELSAKCPDQSLTDATIEMAFDLLSKSSAPTEDVRAEATTKCECLLM